MTGEGRGGAVAGTLRDILDAAARGVFPPPDGGTTVVPQHAHRDAGVIAFTAHSVVFTDEGRAGCAKRWPPPIAIRSPRR